MSFVEPLWWWALAGLSVPLVIHLLSRGRRQRVAIGSIRHLAGSESRAWRRLRLSGWQQLLLRMALLAVLAMALSGPRWVRSPVAAEGSWVLIEPELLGDRGRALLVESAIAPLIEQAVERAASVRVLTAGLPRVSEYQESAGETPDAWSLMLEADGMAPPGTDFNLFTTNRVELLRGQRPVIGRRVEWQVVEDHDSNRWIQRVSARSGADLLVTIGESGASGTRFHSLSISATDRLTEDSGLVVDLNAGELYLAERDPFPGDDRVSLSGSQDPLRVSVALGENRNDDLWYLRQALETVGGYLGREIEWVEEIGSPTDLEIRLGGEMPRSFGSRVVLADVDLPYESCQAEVNTPFVGGTVRLARCAAAGVASNGVAWWVDSWGEPFLSRWPDSAAAVYQLQSRFSSRWSDLVTDVALPRLLLALVAPDAAAAGGAAAPFSDRRAAAGSERLPLMRDSGAGSSVRSSEMPELLLWCLVAVLLIAERWWAGRES